MKQYQYMLSILVPIYNQEAYIVQCLDSILMQKTQYDFEVLVGEDASTDGSRAVLKRYEAEHPGFLNIFYREKNMYHSACTNQQDLRSRSKGKYMITLEGDDFWTDENKIEKQIAFLETHPEYIAVAHNCSVVDEFSQPNGEAYPECKENEYSLEQYVLNIYPGQTATLMSRNYYLDPDLIDTSILEKTRIDRAVYFMLCCSGRIYCMQTVMSAYRHVVDKGDSYSAKYRYDYFREETWYGYLIDYAKRINKKKAIVYADVLYLSNLRMGVRRKNISMKEAYKKIVELPYWLSACVFFVIRAIRMKKNRRKTRI